MFLKIFMIFKNIRFFQNAFQDRCYISDGETRLGCLKQDLRFELGEETPLKMVSRFFCKD